VTNLPDRAYRKGESSRNCERRVRPLLDSSRQFLSDGLGARRKLADLVADAFRILVGALL
jgi:hypothetical protein